MFIRTKHIKGKPYAYLVENTWKRGRAKQAVKAYLGRTYHAPPTPPPTPTPETPTQELIWNLIDHELQELEHEIIINRENKSVLYKQKPVVIAMNGGHLCNHTLTKLHKALHTRNEERPGTTLATAFSNAGIRIPPNDFIRLYQEYAP